MAPAKIGSAESTLDHHGSVGKQTSLELCDRSGSASLGAIQEIGASILVVCLFTVPKRRGPPNPASRG
jgi:hypothetical protein